MTARLDGTPRMTASDAEPFLFVYGTLRREADHPMRRWLVRCAEPVGRGRMRGRLYDLGAYPGVAEASTNEEWVIGELHRLTQPAEVIAALDEYEGCGPEDPPPFEFVRERTRVFVGDDAYEAWVYVYARPVAGLRHVLSGDYFAGLD